MTAVFTPEKRVCPKPMATPPGVDSSSDITSYFETQPVALTIPGSAQPDGFYTIYHCLDCSDASLLSMSGAGIDTAKQLKISGQPLTTDTLKAIAMRTKKERMPSGKKSRDIMMLARIFFLKSA